MITEAKAPLLSSKIHLVAEKLWRVALFGPDNYRSAVISRYLHTRDRALRRYAIDYAKDLLDGYINEEITDYVAESSLQYLINFKDQIPFPTPANPRFSFIDLFAGIGGFRIAMQQQQGKCVFTSEWDKMAQKTYFANFGEIPFGDITKPETKRWIPNSFDILCGGFPCQPFSLAGVSKKNSLGRKHGFEDERQGNLFFHIAEIIEKYRPRAFFLENVKNLMSHDKGNTFKVIKETLEGLNYTFYHKVLDGKHFVPQHRERTFMVGFDKNVYRGEEQFNFPEMPKVNRRVMDLLEENVDPKYTLSDKLWNYLQEYAKKHQQKGNGFGFGLVNPESITRTISARYYKDGAEVLIPQEGMNPRRLTPRECASLQGYPQHFVIPVSDNQAYKQFGNSVVVPLIAAIGEQVVNTMLDFERSMLKHCG